MVCFQAYPTESYSKQFANKMFNAHSHTLSLSPYLKYGYNVENLWMAKHWENVEMTVTNVAQQHTI